MVATEHCGTTPLHAAMNCLSVSHPALRRRHRRRRRRSHHHRRHGKPHRPTPRQLPLRESTLIGGQLPSQWRSRSLTLALTCVARYNWGFFRGGEVVAGAYLVLGGWQAPRVCVLIQDFIDTLLDWIVFFLALWEGDFDFANDKQHVLESALIAVACLGTCLYLTELLHYCAIGRLHSFIFVAHTAFEDFLQIILYALVAVSNAYKQAPVKAPIAGVLQSLFFLILKLVELGIFKNAREPERDPPVVQGRLFVSGSILPAAAPPQLRRPPIKL